MFANVLLTGSLATLSLVVLGVVAVALLARRDRIRAAQAIEWTAPLTEIIDAGQRDPLDAATIVDTIDLADALIYAELTAANPVPLDWQPLTFTQEWRIAGERMRELGDTQQMQAIAA